MFLNTLYLYSRLSVYVLSDPERLVSQNSSTANLCLTPGCVTAAAEIFANLDKSVDPCSDFYRFACGGWLNRHAIPEDRSSISVSSEVQNELDLKLRVLMDKKLTGSEPEFIKMIKSIYDTCLDLETMEKLGADPLKKVLKSLGGWPVVEGSKWYESNFDWIDSLIQFRKLGFSHRILLGMSISADYKNNTFNTIYLDQPSLGGPDRTSLLSGLNDSSTAAYFQLMVKSAKLLGAEENTVENELLRALHFEIALANYSLALEERKNYNKMYNKYTVDQLQQMVPEIPWQKYFNGLLSDEILGNETVIVSVPDFVVKFAKLITSTEKRVVANYMIWRVVARSISMLSKKWREIAQKYNSVLSGKTQEVPRWKKCVDSLTGNLDIALSSYYVRNFFKEESKDSALELVTYIHKEFLKILDENDWMDEQTKKQAKPKANAIKPYIGYPKEFLNNTAVMELYVNLTFTNDSYFDNIMSLRKWSTDNKFSQLRKQNIRYKKLYGVTEVNAFYEGLENRIVLPAGILQNAFFNKDRPHYMNFGAIGYIIGHEITHGFDNKGRQFDKNGNNVNWWDKSTDELFKERAQCLVDQYNKYTAENGMSVNGVLTQGENIADNGGLKEAYRAYRSWVKDNGEEKLLPGLKFTQSQLFWISAANTWCAKYRPEALQKLITYGSHSPSPFRVIGPMSNLPEFSKDFNCPPESPMNRKQKCEVW